MHNLILFLLLVTFLPSCKDDHDACFDDPDCEYFRCKVNGEDWSTNCERDPLFGCSAIDVQYYKDIPGLDFSLSNSDRKDGFILYLRNNIVLGENKFHSNNSLKSYYFKKDLDVCNLYYVDTLSTNILRINLLDTINYKMEGTFIFSSKNECNETVKITDGNFRVKYRF